MAKSLSIPAEVAGMDRILRSVIQRVIDFNPVRSEEEAAYRLKLTELMSKAEAANEGAERLRLQQLYDDAHFNWHVVVEDGNNDDFIYVKWRGD